VNRLGTDKPNTAISSTGQTIVNKLNVTEDSRDPVTHIRGLGAQQGDQQVTATDTIASYSTGDRKVWRKYENKDIVEQSRLQEIVSRLADEYDAERRRVTVEAGLVDVDVSLGDRVTVDLPENDINRLLRIVSLREIIDSGRRFIATLTNREVERGGAKKRRDDLQRFNSGWQGFVDRDVDSYGWQPVTATVNAQRPYPYPDDVAREDVAEVVVNSIPYRAYSSGGAAGGDHFHQVPVTITSQPQTDSDKVEEAASSFSSTFIDDTSFEVLTTISPTNSCERLNVNLEQLGLSNTVGLEWRLYNTDTFEYFPDDSVATVNTRAPAGSISSTRIDIPADVSGDNIEVQVQSDDSSSAVTPRVVWWTDGEHIHGVDDTETTDASGDHTHPVEPGLEEFPAETASGVDLVVNGNTVATDIGSGEFTTTVDISGQLTAGDNTIEAVSDTLGLINLTVRTQLFRQGSP
jgi:hypothetical protein